MHEHGTKCIPGPLRGTRGWWQELGQHGVAAEPPKKRSRKKPSTGDKELFRAALVARIRKQIAAGTYDTVERWEAALDKLLDHLEKE